MASLLCSFSKRKKKCVFGNFLTFSKLLTKQFLVQFGPSWTAYSLFWDIMDLKTTYDLEDINIFILKTCYIHSSNSDFSSNFEKKSFIVKPKVVSRNQKSVFVKPLEVSRKFLTFWWYFFLCHGFKAQKKLFFGLNSP